MRDFLRQVEAWAEAGAEDEALAALAYAGGRAIELDEDELAPASRRAVLVLAAGGDPHRDFALDDRAVLVFAEAIDDPERRTSLQRGLAALRGDAGTLPHVYRLVSDLLADTDLAWRVYSASLLADTLSED